MRRQSLCRRADPRERCSLFAIGLRWGYLSTAFHDSFLAFLQRLWIVYTWSGLRNVLVNGWCDLSLKNSPHARFMGRCVSRQHIPSCLSAPLDRRLVFKPLYDMANKPLNVLSLPLTWPLVLGKLKENNWHFKSFHCLFLACCNSPLQEEYLG